jgi:hypothetical protein
MPIERSDQILADWLIGKGFKVELAEDDDKDGNETTQFDQPSAQCRLNYRDKEQS